MNKPKSRWANTTPDRRAILVLEAQKHYAIARRNTRAAREIDSVQAVLEREALRKC